MADDFFTEDAKQVFARILQVVEGGSAKTLPKATTKPSKPKRPVQAVSTKAFNSKTLARMDAQVARRNRQVSRAQQKKLDEEEAAHTYKPKINAHSKRLSRGELPLHQRIPQILEEKQEHIQALQTQFQARDDEELSELTFRPHLVNKPSQRHRSFDAVYQDLQSWNKQRTEKQERLREVKQASAVIEPKPRINKNSSALAKHIVPFETRLQQSVEQWQHRKNEQAPRHSFSPAITAKAKNLHLNQGVFERLTGKSGGKLFSESSQDQILNLLADL